MTLVFCNKILKRNLAFNTNLKYRLYCSATDIKMHSFREKKYIKNKLNK